MDPFRLFLVEISKTLLKVEVDILDKTSFIIIVLEYLNERFFYYVNILHALNLPYVLI